MNAKKLISLILAIVMVMAIAFSTVACNQTSDNANDGNDENKTYTVGICQLIQHPALDAATQGFMDALKAELGDKVTFLSENASGDPQVCNTIVETFVNKKVDLIMANATPALQAAAKYEDIPVLGTSITEYGVALGIDNFSGTVGGNISGTSDLAPLDKQADMILELYPEAKTVGLLYCSAEANSKYQVKVVGDYLKAKGLTVTDYAFENSNDATIVAATAASACDVLYIPTDNTAANAAEVINNVIGDTPVIAGEEGICAGTGVATLTLSYYDLGYATGKMAAKILKGEADISTMPVEYVSADKLTKKYNAEKCAQLGIDTEALEAAGYVAIGD